MIGAGEQPEEWTSFAAEPLHAGVVGPQERSSGLTGILLGVRIDGATRVVRQTPPRDWKLKAAIRSHLRRPAVSGQELDILVGHLTSRALLSRSRLSIFHLTYARRKSGTLRLDVEARRSYLLPLAPPLTELALEVRHRAH